MPLIEPGRKAPAFSAPDQSGTVHSLKSLKGSAFVLYFYPKDDTPGCTVEACAFRDGWARFRKAGVTVLGVSPDGAESHARFARKFRLPFPLLADEPGAGKAPRLCAAFGTWQEKSMYGKKYMGVARTTYVIGPDGKVAARFDKVKPDGHADEVLAAVAALPSAACTRTTSSSASAASAPARRSPRTRPATRRASTSTRASKRR
ncbi:MAG: peroxiredoxin [Planctomycetes bacterium]|nr:peroxiredoxin [Planctomycetota bacterium]